MEVYQFNELPIIKSNANCSFIQQNIAWFNRHSTLSVLERARVLLMWPDSALVVQHWERVKNIKKMQWSLLACASTNAHSAGYVDKTFYRQGLTEKVLAGQNTRKKQWVGDNFTSWSKMSLTWRSRLAWSTATAPAALSCFGLLACCPGGH